MKNPKKIKIGIFDPYLDDLGGGERYMMTLAKCLSNENDVTVFWDNDQDLKNIEKRFSLDLSKVNIEQNIFKFPFIRKQKMLKKYDTVVFLSDGSIPVVSSRNLYIHMQQPIHHKLTAKEKIKLKRVRSIFCNSKFTKDFIEKNYGVNCKLLYPPVSIYGNKNKKENIILHVGRFRVMNVSAEDYKKQQTMIDMFKNLVDKGLINWKLIMAVSIGDEKDHKFLEMKKTAINYPIEFLVNSNMDDLWEKGRSAKIYWHATGFGEDLEKNPHLAEHFGISTVEAMGVGAVPVVFNAGGQREIVMDGKNGFLWNSLQEFENKTLKVINDSNLMLSLSEAAFKRSKDFDDKVFCKNVQDLINV